MKDTIITKTIPVLHKNILLFFATLFFLFFFTFIALLEGVGIDRLIIGEVKIEKLYLKWENALLIKASKIDMGSIADDREPFDLSSLEQLPRYIRWAERWIESAEIDIIKYEDYSASLSYHKDRNGFLAVRYGNVSCKGFFTIGKDRFRFALPSCRIGEGELSGKMGLELQTRQLRLALDLRLPDTPVITLSGTGDGRTFHYAVHARDDLGTIKPLVRFFGVDPDVAPWISDYATGSSVRLHKAEGSFRYDAPQTLAKTLVASATVMNGGYTFAKGFEPIRAERVELLYKAGKLYITPHGGTFYGLPTETSRLWIDFTLPDTTLTALIQTRQARLNDPILNLLHHYGIHLPLKQTAGECAVDLNLTVDLHTLNTTAAGTFEPTPSDLLLDKIPLKTTGGVVRLDTRHVVFKNFTAEYGGIARGYVNGEYDAQTGKGKVLIDAFEAKPLPQINLVAPATPLKIVYTIASEGNTLSVSPSSWNLMGKKLEIGGFDTAFDYRNARLSFQSLPFSIPATADGEISARFDGAKQQTDISVLLKQFSMDEIVLLQSPFAFDIHHRNDGTVIHSPLSSGWSFSQLPLLLSPFTASIKDDRFLFEDSEIVLGDLLKGKFSGKYQLGIKSGSLQVEEILPISPKLVPLIDPKSSLDLLIDAREATLRLYAPALKAGFSTIPHGWKIALDDISLLSKRSPLLRHYHINKGHMNLYYAGEGSPYRFEGSIDYPYQLMLVNGIPQSRYRFTGAYREGTTSIRVNNRLTIDHTPEYIYARGSNAGIHVPEFFRFLSSLDQGKTTGGQRSQPVRIHVANTYLHLAQGRKIAADTLDATLDGNDIDASLGHAAGKAALKVRDGTFYVTGEHFNDSFMNQIFSFGDIEGGDFSFEAHGTAEKFEGIARVQNAVLRDYKVLNNVLAFINTIPSLTTFSLPNYHSQGLPVDEGYARVSYNKGIVKMDNITLDSPEMKILGEGRVDIERNTLEGRMMLKTDLGSVLGKVPMVGYILFGDDGSIATTVSLSGRLDDPKVETSIAKEVIAAPFNILKRTIIYPFLWMIPDEEKK